jgi:L-amino acid N-acyltransferase YncA
MAMEVSRDGIPVGYAWLSYLADDTVELHVCADPDEHGKVVTKRVLKTLHQMMKDTGATHVVAFHQDPKFRDMIERLGFESCGTMVHVLDQRIH